VHRTTRTRPVRDFLGPLAYWVASLAACAPVVIALGQALTPFDLEVVIAPHFLSGPLDARQRFEFLRWHMDHHRQQITDIMARQHGQAERARVG
jgi:hypothetical protein